MGGLKLCIGKFYQTDLKIIFLSENSKLFIALILCQKFKQNTRPGTAWQTFFLATMIKIPSSNLLHVLQQTFCVISHAIY